MVRGLNVFRERFAGFEGRYVLIGGTAVEIAMDAAALAFRVTRDLDIVLHVESLDAEFATAFWTFITDGGYEFKEKSAGKPKLYRFSKPEEQSFPYMLELFSRKPDLIEPPADCHLTPLPIAEEVSSLSAILLDDEYYEFVQDGTRVVDGLSVLAPEYIVPLKARAWIDLTERRERGEAVSRDDIKKHRNDIIRLSQLVSPAQRIALPDAIRVDLAEFVARALRDGAEPRTFGVIGMSLQDVRSLLGAVYYPAGSAVE
ncbi:MAG: hypothetical protein KJ747_02590 [Actinobacteria bacterium]|nr:hypothetical protein [Actinomycetota bacterium]MCG2806667.1 hypothetical protein [Coriobacteriia bacterium]